MELADLPGYRWAISGQYDGVYGRSVPAVTLHGHRALAPYVQRVVAALALPVGAHHLDVGCGSGLAALAVARAVPDARVLAMDASPGAVAAARAAVDADGLAARVQVEDGDAASPPPGPFNGITALSVFNLLADKPEALDSWRRVAVVGARLVITDAFAEAGPGAGDAGGPGPVTRARFHALARSAGWSLVGEEDLTALVHALHVERTWPWAEYVRDGFSYRLVVLESP